jgi:hypothetical protein
MVGWRIFFYCPPFIKESNHIADKWADMRSGVLQHVPTIELKKKNNRIYKKLRKKVKILFANAHLLRERNSHAVTFVVASNFAFCIQLSRLRQQKKFLPLVE